ncbi:hypothetical protein Esti_000726 [Eimeria stiedai]
MLRCRRAGIDVPHLLWVQPPPSLSGQASQGASDRGSFLGAPLKGPWGAPSAGGHGAPQEPEAGEGGSRILMEWVEGCTVKALLDLLHQKGKKKERDEETTRRIVHTVPAAALS